MKDGQRIMEGTGNYKLRPAATSALPKEEALRTPCSYPAFLLRTVGSINVTNHNVVGACVHLDRNLVQAAGLAKKRRKRL